MPKEDVSSFKRCLQAIAGIPVEAAINTYGSDLTPEQATYLRSLTQEDIARVKETETSIYKALGESGDGCGIYN